MKAMILCAGLGTRLRPVTDTIPKPLLPFFGKAVVEHTMDRLVEAGVESFVINLHHLPGKIISAIGSVYRGVPVVYSHEPEILGPVGGIRKALSLLGEEPFFVVNGDVVMNINYKSMFEKHKITGAALTLASGPGIERPDLRALGVDGNGRIRQVWDKPEWKGAELEKKVNLGAFIYDPGIVRDFIPDGVFYDFRTQLIPALFEAGKPIIAFMTDSYWNDIGTPESYLKAHMDVFNGKTKGYSSVIADEVSGPRDRCYFEKNVVIEEETIIGPCVAAYRGSIIKKGSVLKNVVVLPGAVTEAYSKIEGVVIL